MQSGPYRLLARFSERRYEEIEGLSFFAVSRARRKGKPRRGDLPLLRRGAFTKFVLGLFRSSCQGQRKALAV